MDEYISKKEVLDYLNGYLHSLGYDNTDLIVNGQRHALINVLEDILTVKAADVQPAPQWISVDERVPDNDAPVLVWYEYWRYGDYNCMWQAYGIAQYIYDRWTGEDLNGSRVKVLAWQPLPEPPKE